MLTSFCSNLAFVNAQPEPGTRPPELESLAVTPHMSEGITRLLDRWNTGDPEAMQELLTAVYGDLRRIADRVLAHERSDHTLQPTALVHELYLQFVGLRAMQIGSQAGLSAVPPHSPLCDFGNPDP